MAASGIRGAKRRGKPWRTTTPNPDAARRPDLAERDFTASSPNELWVADFERHEASWNRAVMKGHRGWLVAAGRCKLGAA
jgi:transposase InsO family protein